MSVSRGGDLNEKSEYIDSSVVMWSNTWDWSDNHNADSVDGRDAIKTVELERPDDHLIEIHGVYVAVGDPVEGDLSDGKWDCFIRNDADPPSSDTGWPNHGIHDDDLMVSLDGQKVSDDVNGGHSAWHTNGPVWFPKPFLSTGKLGILFRTSPNDSVGELALYVYYSYVEVDNDTLTRHILERE
jgi:hypothetical protein